MKKLFVVAFILTSCQQNEDLKLVDLKISNPLNNPNARVIPKCADTCPKDFRILKGKNNDRDYLAFANFGHRGVGRCRGHAIVNQKVYELSNFKYDTKLDCNTTKLSDECKKIVSEKINKIMNFQVQDFPGFKNLYEFSNHPQIKEMLKSYVRSIGHRYRALRAEIRDRNYENEKEAIFHEVIMRVKERQRPYIGIKGAAVGNHAVIAHEERFIDKRSVLCVHDSNIILHQYKDNCHNYLYMEDGDVYYKRHNMDSTILYILSLTNDEDKRVAKYIEARYNYCINNTKCK